MKKKFSSFTSGTLNMKYSLFLENFLSALSKKHSAVQSNSLWKTHSKKWYEFKPLQELYWKSRTFGEKFLLVLSKLLSICRVIIWGRTIFASWILSGNSFGHWETIFQGFAESTSYGCTNCFLRVQRIDVCVQ